MRKRHSRVNPCDTLCVEPGRCMVPCNVTTNTNDDIENMSQVSTGKQDEGSGLHNGYCTTMYDRSCDEYIA